MTQEARHQRDFGQKSESKRNARHKVRRGAAAASRAALFSILSFLALLSKSRSAKESTRKAHRFVNLVRSALAQHHCINSIFDSRDFGLGPFHHRCRAVLLSSFSGPNLRPLFGAYFHLVFMLGVLRR